MKKIVFAFVLCFYFISCKKGLPLSCYDEIYRQKHKSDICIQDCPGVLGCDGKLYCNECVMHTNGIKKAR